MKTNTILNGDCIEHMKELPENSVDAIITDPPYGLEFMGKNWDYGVPGKVFFIEMIRVLKPGGFLLSFGGTRTYHRLVCGIEDAGFEIRDTIMWLYGSGFPKSLNIGKQIDKIQGNEREVIGKVRKGRNSKECYTGNLGTNANVTKGNSEWEGWGTALKPAVEPIAVARKPLSEKNVALNVLKWETGGINIDEGRIEFQGEKDIGNPNRFKGYPMLPPEKGWNQNKMITNTIIGEKGRFPANVVLDEEAGKMLDEQSGELSKSGNKKPADIKATSWINAEGQHHTFIGDKGGASRFFYCAKASKSERNFGCEDFEDKIGGTNIKGFIGDGIHDHKPRKVVTKNNHPTVKPIKLMEYLIKLVSKEGAIVLDPFLGSGTTAIACQKLGRLWIGIEKEPEYVKIATARIKPYLEQSKLEVA